MYEEDIHFGKLLLKQSEMFLAHLTPVTLTFNPVPPPKLLPRIVLEQKGKGYIRTDRQTDGRTDRQTNMCKAICSLFFEGVLWPRLSWGVRDDVGRTKLETQIKAKSHHLPKKDWQFPQQSPIHERLTRSHLNKQYSMLLASNSNLVLFLTLYIFSFIHCWC